MLCSQLLNDSGPQPDLHEQYEDSAVTDTSPKLSTWLNTILLWQAKRDFNTAAALGNTRDPIIYAY